MASPKQFHTLSARLQSDHPVWKKLLSLDQESYCKTMCGTGSLTLKGGSVLPAATRQEDL